MYLNTKTKQILLFAFLLCFVFILDISAQTVNLEKRLDQAQIAFDRGDYSRALEIAETVVADAKKAKSNHIISTALGVLARAQISLQKYSQAEKNLDEALQMLPLNEWNKVERAKIFLHFAWLFRAQRKVPEALQYSQKATALTPNNRQILAEHYLNLGRVLFSDGFDVSAIIWLEKAERLLEAETVSPAKLDVFRFLALCWWAKLNYQTALKYARKGEVGAENTRFKQKHRQALFDSATILSEIGQQALAMRTLEKGLELAIAQNNSYDAGIFLTSLLLNSLDNNDLNKASGYLGRLETYNATGLFTFEILLGKAIISAFTNKTEESNEMFSKLEAMENSSEFILPGWKVKIAKRNEDWKAVIQFNQELLELTAKNNFQDELPAIHLDFARAYFSLDKLQLALEHLEKSLAFIEEIRKSENRNLSLALFETYHNAYRLLVQINAEKSQESFELADFLKARLLKDRINNAPTQTRYAISTETRKTLEELSFRYINDQSVASEIEKREKVVTNAVPNLKFVRPELEELNNLPAFENTALVSYFFTLDRKLMAFVWNKNTGLRTVYLPISEDEANAIAKSTQQKIKSLIFFKKDGRELYDKLLKPLNISAKRLILVPDKALWKIPFQALSPDGEKYLIENTQISYAPSVSILLDQLKSPKPMRQALKAFANQSYNKGILQYVNAEATNVARLFNSQAVLNATAADFQRLSDKTDILHFSMHAQVDNDQPLNSFLAFQETKNDNGRITVEDILKTKLKQGSLVFLASCDTINVLSGEGLVSLAWGMMGSGATTVISAQWEANDRSTGIFTNKFYSYYKLGFSSGEAMQKASIEMIKDKATNMHEPYYWADFTVNGDFR